MIIELEQVLTSEEREPDHIVAEFIYQGQVLVFAGEPGVGKSFFMYSMAMCIASGLRFLGKPTAHGPVLYFDEENSRPDLEAYLRRTWRGLGEPPIENMKDNLIIEHFMLAKHGRKRFEYMAKRAEAVRPLLTVIDTATPVCDVKDENDNAEATRIIGHLRVVHEAAGPANSMIILKHAKIESDPEHEGRRTIRGAKAWLGALDGSMYHVIPPGQPRKDGLRNTQIIQDKIRAFGLRDALKIAPEWTGDEGSRGIKLNLKA